jgi:Flp pilus assembly protein TadB
VIPLALVGACLGATVFALIWRLASPRPSALVRLGQFDARHNHLHSSTASASGAVSGAVSGAAGGGWLGRAGTWLTAELAGRGIAFTTLRQDLALTGHSLEWAMGRKLLAGVAGFLLVAATAIGLQLATGWAPPAGVPVVLALMVGIGFSFLTDLEARRQATTRRQEFRRALGAYLDLVALEMAGSAAPAEALPNAARVGAGWPMALLRDTLWRANLSGTDQWEALTELGERIGVGELRDLGTLVRLVGRDGARVRQTLTARAATMRRRELAEAEGLAGQKDQSMRLAQILIGFGFIVFISYPAIVAVMAF